MRSTLPIFFFLAILTGCDDSQNFFRPGGVWNDTNGVAINAHGGGFLYEDGTYYWYGEHKIEGELGNRAQVGVHVYSSKDLYNWIDEGIALAVVENDTTSEIAKDCIIERPKVIYNEKFNSYVMWFHLELRGEGYASARTAVATAKDPTGPFRYIKSFRPHAGIWPLNFPDSLKRIEYDTLTKRGSEKWKEEVKRGRYLVRDFQKGQMARDMTLFIDSNGKAYHIHASEQNQTLHVSELSDDYLSFTGKYARIILGGRNEAPAIIKRNDKYIMITSGLTGWKPNSARLHTSENIFGPWEFHGNPCRGEKSELTFESQSTFILPLEDEEDQYIFIADRWKPQNPIDGRYVWLPISFENGLPVIEWQDHWSY